MEHLNLTVKSAHHISSVLNITRPPLRCPRAVCSVSSSQVLIIVSDVMWRPGEGGVTGKLNPGARVGASESPGEATSQSEAELAAT